MTQNLSRRSLAAVAMLGWITGSVDPLAPKVL